MAGRASAARRGAADAAVSKETDWDRGVTYACWHAKKPEYNALHDPNMRHFFENESLQRHLYRTGLIDKSGRVVYIQKNLSKLNVIEHEFRQAEKVEVLRQKEEEYMRQRVHRKRFDALEKAKRNERILRIREDCRIRNEIVSALRHNQAPPTGTPQKHRSDF